MKKAILTTLSILTLTLLTACGSSSSLSTATGDSTGTGGAPVTTVPTVATGAAAESIADYAGSWSGTLVTNVVTEPFTIILNGSTLTFASAHADAMGTASYDSTTHNLNFTVSSTSTSSNATYTGVLSKSDFTLTLISLSGGAITSGTGSCTPAVAANN